MPSLLHSMQGLNKSPHGYLALQIVILHSRINKQDSMAVMFGWAIIKLPTTNFLEAKHQPFWSGGFGGIIRRVVPDPI